MLTINATPPQGFPDQVIVLDRQAASRHPSRGFYLRALVADGQVAVVDLEGEMTLPGAVRAAVAKGYRPLHWMETTDSQASLLPDGI